MQAPGGAQLDSQLCRGALKMQLGTLVSERGGVQRREEGSCWLHTGVSPGLDLLAEVSGSRRSSSSVQISDGRRQARLFPPCSGCPLSLPRSLRAFPQQTGQAAGVTRSTWYLWGVVMRHQAKPGEG